MDDEYLATNLAHWNSRVPHHVQGYGLDDYRVDPTRLSDVIRFDLPRLGDVRGLDVVHLQCHIGTDTISLARLGARSVTGLDFSQPALDAAAALAADVGVEVTWVCSDLFGAVDVLGPERFDLVYTGIGALCWVPDIRRWAQVVASLLRPGGRLFVRDGHPMMNALADERPDGLLVLENPYFEVAGGTSFTNLKTYVDHEGELESPDLIDFSHGIGEIIGAVLGAGLELVSFDEHRSVPWNPFGEAMVDVGGGEYELRDAPQRLAATFTLRAVKPSSTVS